MACPHSRIDPTPESEAAPAAHRGRIGKIARLPKAIREELDRRLQDGEPHKQLADWLNSLPEVQAVMAAHFEGRPVREQSISEWRQRGHRISLEEQKMRDEVKSMLKVIGGLEGVAKENLTDKLAFYLSAGLTVKLGRLASVPEGIEKDKMLREIGASLVALRRGDLELERLRLQRERYNLRKMTEEEREAEFWKWADENINRDEFCRRRCFTYEQREAACNRILGITPEERGEIVAPPAAASSP
jgi:hypothetical protein